MTKRLGVADPCYRTSISFAFAEGFQPSLVLFLLKKYPCSCFCWAFCSDRSVKPPIEQPHNFYFGCLIASSQQVEGKRWLCFQQNCTKFDETMDKNNLLSWQTFFTLPLKLCDHVDTAPSLKVIMFFPLSTVNMMNFTTFLYQHSLDLAMCSWALFLLPSRKTFPLTNKMSWFCNTMCLQG